MFFFVVFVCLVTELCDSNDHFMQVSGPQDCGPDI